MDILSSPFFATSCGFSASSTHHCIRSTFLKSRCCTRASFDPRNSNDLQWGTAVPSQPEREHPYHRGESSIPLRTTVRHFLRTHAETGTDGATGNMHFTSRRVTGCAFHLVRHFSLVSSVLTLRPAATTVEPFELVSGEDHAHEIYFSRCCCCKAVQAGPISRMISTTTSWPCQVPNAPGMHATSSIKEPI